MAPGMDRSEIDSFLSVSKTPMRLATVNTKNEPNIHPVWYHYANGKIYLMSDKETTKVRNINHSKIVYFSVDTDAMPNRGVKGKGTASIMKDQKEAVLVSEKIVGKYLGDVNSKMAKGVIDAVRNGKEVLVEVTPHFFSTWDYTKSRM